jgi:DNA-damage-inducible protein J
MAKDTSISIRLDSDLKMQSEQILSQLGLNITTVVNMLFHQIVREKAVPLSMSLVQNMSVSDELALAVAQRRAGNVGRSVDEVADEMDKIVLEIENGKR